MTFTPSHPSPFKGKGWEWGYTFSTKRLLEMARGLKDMGELISVLNTLGLASTRVAGLMKAQKFLGGNRDRLDELIDKVMDEVTKDWPGRFCFTLAELIYIMNMERGPPPRSI